MRRLILTAMMGGLLLGMGGCGFLFYPHAKEFAERAKGASEVDTLINLTNMMEAGATSGRTGTGEDQAMRDLHNQLHAFEHTLCDVKSPAHDKPAFALVVTHHKELWAIFKRAGKFADEQPQRSQHLDLFASELRETRETLELLK